MVEGLFSCHGVTGPGDPDFQGCSTQLGILKTGIWEVIALLGYYLHPLGAYGFKKITNMQAAVAAVTANLPIKQPVWSDTYTSIYHESS